MIEWLLDTATMLRQAGSAIPQVYMCSMEIVLEWEKLVFFLVVRGQLSRFSWTGHQRSGNQVQ